ncbi:hypothetical protein JCM6882_004779 [Rhodosporidiobolus microsporus]
MSDGFTNLQYNNTRIEYKCPEGTPEQNQWSEVPAEKDELGLGANVAEGAGCTHFNTWGCSANGGETFTWYYEPDPPMLEFVVLHTIVVSNSPGANGNTALRVASFAFDVGTSIGTTLTPVNFSTTAEPPPPSSTSTTTTSSSEDSTSRSTAAAATKHAGSSIIENNVQSTSISTSIPRESSSSDSSLLGGSNLTFILIASVVGAIVIICLVAALCLRTKPKEGREEAGLLKGGVQSLRKEGSGAGGTRKSDRKRYSSGASSGDSSSASSDSGSDDERASRKGRRYRQLGRAAPRSRQAGSADDFW